MKQETKTCQNCKQQFVIEPDDFDFYEKMKVPAPESCPDCRSQERSAFRNESIFYKRKCDASVKQIISIYSQDKPFIVYDQKYWWSDTWDPMEYGRAYDFNKSFFAQFKELFLQVPRLSIINKQSVNSDYCNYSLENKNCYLCFGGHYNENCAYCWYNWQDKDCYDCLEVIKSELCYQGNFGDKLYKCAFFEYCFDCVDCYFSYNLRGCQNCFLCTNLRTKQYYFLNQPCSKDEYVKKVSSFLNGQYKSVGRALDIFQKLKTETIRDPVYQKNCVRCIGSDLENCKNIQHGFNVEYSEDCKYAYHKITQTYSSMDINKMGYDRSDYCYQTIGCAGLNNCTFCDSCWNNSDLMYCNLCFSSSNLFGCIGLKHKQYCILNKQYSKQEYETLVPKIIQHMNDMPYKDKKDRVYKYGKFFPPELSPFAYNETTAQEYFPLSAEAAAKAGYQWKAPESRDYEITKKPEDLPDTIHNVDGSICDEVIGCQHQGKCEEQCITAFKIIPDELQFYKRMNLPLPRLCHNCRHHQRRKQRNPTKLWHRKCQCAGEKSDNKVYTNTVKHVHGTNHCPNEFETTYSPERKEVVYCKKCYQNEVV
ncbi:hypothetical protein MYX06_00060 [Patescibacteria group bacterium AH-259-L05]|nr:hypothetical protein [Patescibacteria group bacterium AH-259-L05]